MPFTEANDGIRLHYTTYGLATSLPLILLHGFTGSSAVFSRNVQSLSKNHYVIVLDLRGHGDSGKPRAGYHVSRLAMDLKNLIDHLKLPEGQISAIGTSLGAAILWCYAELFTTAAFRKLIFVDQAPLQNYMSDWGPEHGNRGCNSSEALAAIQHTLETDPRTAHLGTISACLGYRSYPQLGDPEEGSKIWQDDEAFFLQVAINGDGRWYGKLMADHTALDWRDSIVQSFGPGSRSKTQVLVVASTRSGCFPAAGPLKVVELINSGNGEDLAEGVAVEWGGHWCYWEQPDKFNKLVLDFLG
ncbi:alpha/beta hydrolase-like protein [Ampelomyces quisqualis]|uniref:Alpha/beta hydrolase-like protein n=1 Tax=Ampelomyces quisqualis TaxID=50730 RepID=A0A6A5QDW6_AMPQU|nr:alpha/beta hydrolase-like protein [Ampelomyces quisqualis]